MRVQSQEYRAANPGRPAIATPPYIKRSPKQTDPLGNLTNESKAVLGELQTQLNKNFQMIYNVKKFKQMMSNKVERDAYTQNTGLRNSQSPEKKKTVDFVKMVKDYDLGNPNIDFQNKPIQYMRDENKIRSFLEEKRQYYKSLQPKRGVFKTEQLPTVSEKGLLNGITSKKLS